MKINSINKKCLLMIPRTFYSYSEYIHEALISIGYKVTICNDEYPDSLFGKLLGKLHIPLLLYITNKVITKKILNDETYDLILIIKGRGMSVSLLGKLKKVCPNIIGYNWESFKFHKAPLKWYKNVNKYYTIDYIDAEAYKLPVVELFSYLPEKLKPDICKYEISAILKNHSDRLQYVDNVLSNIRTKKHFIYIYESNIFTFLINFIKNPFLYIKYRKYITYNSLPYKDYTEVLLNSNFTIDFAHPTQSGLTIRCFEALSSQTKIITNNTFIYRYEHFNETNAIIFNNLSNPTVLTDHYNKISILKPIQYKRTINQFINDLIT